jgi:phage shock protein PspC (stress-responsive transcriptional regulator)
MGMTQNFSGQASAPGTPGQSRYDLRHLRRSSDDRMISGVCGGLGRYTGVDPIIFRVLLATLAVFGGVGLLIYALAWLLIPDDRADTSEAHRLFRGQGSPLMILVAIALGVVGLLALIDFANHGRSATVSVVIVIAVIAVIVASRRTGPNATPGPVSGPVGGYFGSDPTSSPGAPPQPTPYATEPAPYTAQTAAFAPTAGGPPLGPPAGFSPSRPTYAGPPPPWPSPSWPPGPPGPPRPPRPPRPPSFLAPLALSVGVVVTGALFALDASHAIDVTAQAMFASVLLSVGLALVLATWIGRARLLIGVGAILTVGLAVTALIDVPLRGGIGDRTTIVTTATDLKAAYHLGIGQQTLDLGQLQLGGKTVHTAATVGVGHLYVLVPENVVVVAHGRAGLGELRLFGGLTSGSDLNRTASAVTDPRVPGELDLDLRVGTGVVEVIQAVHLPAPGAPLVPGTPGAPTAPSVPATPAVPSVGSNGTVVQP